MKLDELLDEADDEPIWHVVVAGALISAIAAYFVAQYGAEHALLPDEATESGPRALNTAIASGFAAAAATGLVVWAGLHVAVIQSRSSIGKSLIGLSVMLAVACVVAVPTRIGAVSAQIQRAEEDIAAWTNRIQANQDAKARAFVAQFQTLDQNERAAGPLSSIVDVNRKLDVTHQEIQLLEQYTTGIRTDISTIRASLTGSDQITAIKRRALDASERVITDGPVGRTNALELQRLRKQAEYLQFLKDHADAWTVSANHIVFYDSEALERTRSLSHEVEELLGQERAARALAQGAAATGPTATTPTGSDPPPHQ